MKNNGFLYLLMAVAILFCGCNEKKESVSVEERDSLLLLNKELTQTIDFVTSTIDSLNYEQSQLFIFNNDGLEQVDVRTRIKQKLANFDALLSQQKEKIEELEAQLEKKGLKTVQLQKLISILRSQLETKESEIAALRSEVDSGKKQIKELQFANVTLQKNVSEMTEQMEAQEEALAAQDKILNECFVKVGSKSELQSLGLLSKGNLFKKKKVQLGNMRQEGFRAVDIRDFTSLKITGKKVKILTPAPDGSYTLINMDNGYLLKINNPTAFWSLSNYLLIQAD